MVTYPLDWKTDKINNVANVFDNLRIPVTKNQRKSGNTPYYGANGIQDFVSGYTHDGEFVLIAEDGANDLLNYPVAYASGKIWVNNHAHVLSGIESVANTKFLSFSLKKVDYVAVLVGGTRAKLNGKSLKNIEITLPESIPEQQAIASVLTDFDEHIDNLTELIEKKKAIREGALEDLVSGRTRLDGFDGEWEEKSLLECVDLIQGLTYAPENVKPYGILVLRSSNIQNNRLALNDNVYVDIAVSEAKMIQNGDILICVRNGSSALIGKSCTLNEMPHTTFGAFMSVLRGDKTGFISKAFESHYIQMQVRDRTNATINQITKKDFEQIRILLPSQPEQLSIVQVISSMDAEIASLEEEKDKMLQIKAGAMDDLLTGRIRLTR